MALQNLVERLPFHWKETHSAKEELGQGAEILLQICNLFALEPESGVSYVFVYLFYSLKNFPSLLVIC